MEDLFTKTDIKAIKFQQIKFPSKLKKTLYKLKEEDEIEMGDSMGSGFESGEEHRSLSVHSKMHKK